jgi:hypothetical protein
MDCISRRLTLKAVGTTTLNHLQPMLLVLWKCCASRDAEQNHFVLSFFLDMVVQWAERICAAIAAVS